MKTMNFQLIADTAHELAKRGFVSPYELKVPHQELDDLIYEMQNTVGDRLYVGEYVLVRTYNGNVIIRGV